MVLHLLTFCRAPKPQQKDLTMPDTDWRSRTLERSFKDPVRMKERCEVDMEQPKLITATPVSSTIAGNCYSLSIIYSL